jgi:hypothetical protein
MAMDLQAALVGLYQTNPAVLVRDLFDKVLRVQRQVLAEVGAVAR